MPHTAYQPVSTSDNVPDIPTPHSPTSMSNSVTVNLTNMQSGTTQAVTVPLQTTILELKQKYYAAEYDENKLIRVIYLGRVLPDGMTLLQCSVQSNHTLHVHISDKLVQTDTPADGVNQHDTYAPQHSQYRVIDLASQRDIYPANYHNFTNFRQVGVLEGGLVDVDVDERQARQLQYEGSHADFVLGVFMGLILGPLSVFWLFTITVSRRQKAGIFKRPAAQHIHIVGQDMVHTG